jgi:predicted N-acyltransferase
LGEEIAKELKRIKDIVIAVHKDLRKLTRRSDHNVRVFNKNFQLHDEELQKNVDDLDKCFRAIAKIAAEEGIDISESPTQPLTDDKKQDIKMLYM